MRQALEGIKVADFTWGAVGPITTKYLSDHGATVVKIESITRPDGVRTAAPYKDRIPGVNRSGWFSYYSTNKYSLSLNLSHTRGAEVARKLVAWCDIVAENFSPGVMERWGLGYEDLKRIKPSIIMFSCSAQGQDGPYAKTVAFGFQLIGLCGFTHMTGWPDRPPSQGAVAYTNILAPRIGAAAIMAALDRRAKTGEGQHIDLSQFELSITYFMGPVILDCIVNGREQTRMGNSCPYAAPHGVYRCRGDDRWCAVAVFTDQEWKDFCKVIGNPPWTKEAKFSTLLERKKNEAELDKLVEEWTVNHSAEEVMKLMQAAGVGAGLVENAEDIFKDPQLVERKHFQVLNHPEIGPLSHPGQAFKLSKTPSELRTSGPCLGEHTEYICRELLGMSQEEFDELLLGGVFQ